MKPYSILSLAIFLLVFCSCRKERFEEIPSVNLRPFNDTCSYSINGKLYSGGNMISRGGGTANVNNDPRTGIGNPDSVMFNAWFSLRIAEGGLFKINLLKKYGKNQFADGAFLPNTPFFTSLFSEKKVYDSLGFYALGERKYALDFDLSTYNQNGVAISIRNLYSGVYETYTSYFDSFGPQNWEIQKDSYFEILKYNSLPTGGHALEAKFTVNLFNWKGQQQRIENGYLLIHVY